MAEVSIVKLSSDGCHQTLLMISQYWQGNDLVTSGNSFGWASVDPDLLCHVASLGHNELTWSEALAIESL